jgi:hypothetical protein
MFPTVPRKCDLSSAKTQESKKSKINLEMSFKFNLWPNQSPENCLKNNKNNSDLAWTSAPRLHGRMARGGHGLPKVSPGPAMPYPSTPCRRTTYETALRLFQGWPAHRAGSLWPFSAPLDTPCCDLDTSFGLCHFPQKSWEGRYGLAKPHSIHYGRQPAGQSDVASSMASKAFKSGMLNVSIAIDWSISKTFLADL